MSKVIDKNNIPKLLEVLDALWSHQIQIGIFGSDDSTILMIAAVHEFGCKITVTPKMRAYLHSQGLHLKASTKQINIPERSFIRAGFDEQKERYEKRAAMLLDKVIHLELPVGTFFNILGEYVAGQLQEYLTDLRTPPNSPFTIARKGSSNPLIATGLLRQKITHKVVKA
ncbi:MAG: hypothetical protein GX811_12655 [Lentisphaerae bacterium]|nr:hypothetical protein [Lentisphaerota bacterium]